MATATIFEITMTGYSDQLPIGPFEHVLDVWIWREKGWYVLRRPKKFNRNTDQITSYWVDHTGMISINIPAPTGTKFKIYGVLA